MKFPLKYKDYLIRPEKVSDYKEYKKFQNELVKEGVDIAADKKKSLKECKSSIEKMIKNMKKNTGFGLFAFKNNKIVGGTGVFVGDNKTKHIAGFFIALDKNERGKGLGNKLTELIIKIAKKELKVECIELGVFKRNKVAINLYKKHGFKTVATIPKKFKINKKYYDELIMQKWLI